MFVDLPYGFLFFSLSQRRARRGKGEAGIEEKETRDKQETESKTT